VSDFLYGVKEVTVTYVLEDNEPGRVEVRGEDASGNGYVLMMSKRVAYNLKEQLQEVFKTTEAVYADSPKDWSSQRPDEGAQ
jgi:hypothetical protein